MRRRGRRGGLRFLPALLPPPSPCHPPDERAGRHSPHSGPAWLTLSSWQRCWVVRATAAVSQGRRSPPLLLRQDSIDHCLSFQQHKCEATDYGIEPEFCHSSSRECQDVCDSRERLSIWTFARPTCGHVHVSDGVLTSRQSRCSFVLAVVTHGSQSETCDLRSKTEGQK
jgi:hypothetical protein